MLRGLYMAGQGMLLQRRHMDVITNNIANSDTTGFKREMLVSHSFDSVMVQRINDVHSGPLPRAAGPQDVGRMHMGTQVDQLFINFDPGGLEETERSTDLALIGDVFFVLQTPDGERFTRAGAFYVDDLGYLVDGVGNLLLGADGPINVGGLNFEIDAFGGVRVDGELAATIRVVSFEDNNSLRKQGSNLFFSIEDPLEEPAEFRIIQGFLETSNVDIGREMVDMLTTFRAYETNQRILSMIDETLGRAVNEIARLR